MNRADLQKISQMRRADAHALLSAGRFAGAYYLAGYAVECALKACIAKQIGHHDFPDKKLVNDAHTHDLDKLVRLAGLQPDLESELKKSPDLEINWSVVKEWSEQKRYDRGVSKARAKDLYSACVARKYGVLAWIKKRW
ncbi:MAG TPA: hypothetical protein VFG91_01070 [Woeseiaceae bacterium]|nr:hypothetical protein [Woeseiaceae bacterium]